MKTRIITLLLCWLFCVLKASGQQPLVADFRADKTRSCTPAIVTFEDRSLGNPISWQWDFGNGNSSTLRNPTSTYLEPGTYTVTLIVRLDSSTADTIIKEDFIHIAKNPAIAFSATQESGCSPVRMQFKDATVTDSSTRIVTWDWDFGDGTKSAEQNPEHIYRQEGSYAVTLKVTDDLGCTNILLKPRFINVTGGIAPGFTASEPPVCGAPAPVTFTNASSGPGTLSYTWLFGDGGTSTEANPTHIYNQTDTFTVSLVVRSSAGCFDTLVREKIVKIQTYTTDFFLEGNACPGVAAQLVNKSTPTPTAASWLFPDGSTSTEINPRKIFAAPGSYAIRLINTYGSCSDTLTRNITVAAPPTIDFSTTDTARCEPNLVARFQNNTNAARYAWEFGDNNFSTDASPTHTYTAFGSYNVTLTATSAEGCISTLTKPAYINIRKATIALSNPLEQGCLPFVYTPQVSINSIDQITNYQWDFGNGQTATGANPSITYTNQGTYNVTLTVTTSGGCTVTQVFQGAVKVGTKPRADFSADPLNACASTAITFTNNSVGADEYRWEFGDGDNSSAFAPKHEYSDTGSMDVRLIAFNSGCADTLLKRAYVYIKPSISVFSYIPNCAKPLEFTFADRSIGPQSWQWNFGDGTTFTGQTPPVHTFPKEGSYQVSLTTTNGSCSHTYTRTITIGKVRLDFAADPRVACKPANINFTPVESDLGAVATLTWQFSNGTIFQEQVSGKGGTQASFDVAGDYDVKLVTIDTFGCRRDSVTKLQYLRINGPDANFTSPNAQTCVGNTVDFIDSTITDGRNQVVSWEWNFGTDGTQQTFQAPPFTHKYDTLGAFNVRLKVTDAAGCTDVETKQLFVQTSTIKAGWSSPIQTCPGSPVTFTNNTAANVFTSVWSFGDGDTSTLNNAQHSFRDTGYFTIKLKVTNPAGCSDSLERAAHVYSGLPKADFDAVNFTTFCIPYEAKFFNRSEYYVSQVWDLAQGISRLSDPTAFYTQKGQYKITLAVTSPGGCVDTISKFLTVKDPREGKIEYTKRRECKPITVDFKAFDSLKGRFVWDFGDGVVADTTVNVISHTYNDFGSYVPKVILYEPSGCVLILSGTDTLQAIGVRAKFGVNQNLFCDEGTLVIQDSTTHNDDRISYQWTFGDGPATSTQPSPTHFYNKPGTYQVTLKTITNSGCADSTGTSIKVSETPVIGITGDTAFCQMERRPYTHVLQNPNSDTISWAWRLPNGSTTNLRDPGMQVFTDSGDFVITAVAKNADGCTDSSFKKIRVHPLPVITTPQPITILAGQTTLLPVLYSEGIRKYFWSPAQSLTCTNCPQPVAGPKVNTRYAINVIDSNTCRALGEVQVNVICTGANVFAPNTFSPNGDGRNDVFFLRGAGLDRIRLLRVFNRWGEVVFEKRECPINDATAGWDGKYKGNRPQPDVYVYQAEVYCITGEIIRWEGNVALIQ